MNTSKNRLPGLDYLRGLAAFGVMIYHYISWTYGDFDADAFLGRFGIYGVAIFYILSGLTLFHVYHGKLAFNLGSLQGFFKKRFFRIFPLLWLATIGALVLDAAIPDFTLVALNLSGAFSVISPHSYIATGAWSIGNELVFYLFFPVFIYATRKSPYLFSLVVAGFLAAYLFFAFNLISPTLPLAEQWHRYVNPFNQAFLFLTGFLLAQAFRERDFPQGLAWLVLGAGVALFCLYPASGDQVNIVTGVNRLVFTLASAMICLGAFKVDFKLQSWLATGLLLLGEISYSVYLLHPLVNRVLTIMVDKTGLDLPGHYRVPAAICITLGMSYLVYQYFEKYFMRFTKGEYTLKIPKPVHK
ncbi:acyltransferase family protein [Rufibacter soli]